MTDGITNAVWEENLVRLKSYAYPKDFASRMTPVRTDLRVANIPICFVPFLLPPARDLVTNPTRS